MNLQPLSNLQVYAIVVEYPKQASTMYPNSSGNVGTIFFTYIFIGIMLFLFLFVVLLGMCSDIRVRSSGHVSSSMYSKREKEKQQKQQELSDWVTWTSGLPHVSHASIAV